MDDHNAPMNYCALCGNRIGGERPFYSHIAEHLEYEPRFHPEDAPWLPVRKEQIMTVRIEFHAEDSADARWRATADVGRVDGGAPAFAKPDQYGGYGATPLEATMKLAQTLADVIGYERLNGVGAADRPGSTVANG